MPNKKYFKKQLASIGSQDYKNIELIVYNDFPNGENLEHDIKEIIGDIPFIYIHGEMNLGYIKAFEKLVGLAHGEYICFCDQDDIWRKDRISSAVKELDKGFVLAACDRSIIDEKDNQVIPSWKKANKNAPEMNWKSGDDITIQACFTCYSIGMGTIMRTDVAKSLIPFPPSEGHDKWLAAGASEIGKCAFIDEPLVLYRRHGNNLSGTFDGIDSKKDWYEKRVRASSVFVRYFEKRFPESPHLPEIKKFMTAREEKDAICLFRNRKVAPLLAYFEIVLSCIPEPIFKKFVKYYKSTNKI